MNVKKVFLFVCVISLFSQVALAQRENGKVVVIEDTLISILQQKRLDFVSEGESEVVERKAGTKGTALGFRVQIYTGTSRDGAYAAQNQFRRIHPEISTYVSYTQPNYRVKVGDFRSRGEAQALMRALSKDFNVFLFTEQVNVVY